MGEFLSSDAVTRTDAMAPKKSVAKKSIAKKSRIKKKAKRSRKKVKRSRSVARPESKDALPTEDELLDSLAGKSGRMSEDSLRAIFGGDLDRAKQLAQDIQDQRRSRRRRPKVLLLPGIMGSTLGHRRPFLIPDDVIWLGLTDIVLGRLKRLRIGADRKIEPLGVFWSFYALMKLNLQAAGYDVDYYPFDWRLSLDQLGRKLAREVAKEPRSVSIVAHSMGGLVARAALRQGMSKVDKFIMLGTPNHGSLDPVVALRGHNGLARIMAGADVIHDSEELASKVFSTFPGLYQMILQSSLHADLNLFDPSVWPAAGPQPSKTLLRKAAIANEFFAQPSDTPRIPWFMIAGTNQSTKVSAKVRGGEFVYEIANEGDGTVPLASAKIAGVQDTFFTSASHGQLANDRGVRRAVLNLLSEAPVSLRTTPGTVRQRAKQFVTESEWQRGRRSAPLTERELTRAILNEDTTPPEIEIPHGRKYTHRLESVTIGRKKQRRIEIAFYQGSITDIDTRAYVVGTFSRVAPSGAARAIDSLMDGAIMSLSRNNMFGARQGEVFILPTGRHPVRAEFIVFAGLGSFDEFIPFESPMESVPGSATYVHPHYFPAIEAAAENASRTLASANVEDFATVLLGGSVSSDLNASGESMLRGFLRGLEDADHGQRVRRVVVCELDPDRYTHIKDHLVRLATTRLCEDIEFVMTELDPPPEVARLRALGVSTMQSQGRALPEPTYLLVRQRPLPPKNTLDEWTFSVLAPTGRAAIRVHHRQIERVRVENAIRLLRNGGTPINATKLKSLSQLVSKTILDDMVVSELADLSNSQLVVLHDAPSSVIPWETLQINGRHPAMDAGLSRRFLASGAACGRWRPTGTLGRRVSLLLISNPTEDLDGTKEEAKAIRSSLLDHGAAMQFQIDELTEGEATRARILEKLKTGRYDFVHYAGHAFFDKDRPESSGLICANEDVLTGSDLAGIPRLPFLLFLNACQSARIRKPKQAGPGMSVAESLLHAGIPHFLGTYWPVADASAATFSAAFYEKLLLNGEALGDAVTHAREAIPRSPDRLDYLLFGNPSARWDDQSLQMSDSNT